LFESIHSSKTTHRDSTTENDDGRATTTGFIDRFSLRLRDDIRDRTDPRTDERTD